MTQPTQLNKQRTPLSRPPQSPLAQSATNLLASSSNPKRPTPSSPPTQKNSSRARDLLRKHYGLNAGPPPPPANLENTADPMNIDSVAFDSKTYYEQLITASSLSSLLKEENKLLTEIRQLDSERQSLVYNHHHELIAASDTIARMKIRAEGLDANLDLLRGAFSEISRLVAEISTEQVSQAFT